MSPFDVQGIFVHTISYVRAQQTVGPYCTPKGDPRLEYTSLIGLNAELSSPVAHQNLWGRFYRGSEPCRLHMVGGRDIAHNIHQFELATRSSVTGLAIYHIPKTMI